jgi:hypothetical protein
MILVNQPHGYISVDVKSQGFALASASLSEREFVDIDLSKIELKKTKYNRYVAAVATRAFRYEIMSQLNVDDVGKEFKPDSIYFVFDSLISKTVPVKLSAKINYMDGFAQYGLAQIDPKSVIVKGPALSVRKISFVNTDSLFMTGINENISKELGLQFSDPLITSETKLVKVNVATEKFSQFTAMVPIQVNSNVPNIKVKTFPSKVKISFQMALPDYKILTDTSFVVSVRLDSLDLLQQNKLLLSVDRKPANVGSVDLSSESVEYVIVK